MKRLFNKVIPLAFALALTLAIMFNNAISASAATNDKTVEVTDITSRIGIMLKDGQALCLQRTVTRPTKGVLYIKVENPEISFDLASLKKIAIVAEMSGNNSDEHVVGYQSAAWTVTDNADTNQAKLFGGPSAKALADSYVETAQEIDLDKYIVDVEFYESVTGEYQMLATFNVSEKVVEETTDPEPETKEEEKKPEPEVKDEEEKKPEPEVKVEEEKKPEPQPDEDKETQPEPKEEDKKPEPQPDEDKEPEDPFKVLDGEPHDFPDAPQTGDSSNLTLWVSLLVLSAGALVVLFAKHKKNEE